MLKLPWDIFCLPLFVILDAMYSDSFLIKLIVVKLYLININDIILDYKQKPS